MKWRRSAPESDSAVSISRSRSPAVICMVRPPWLSKADILRSMLHCVDQLFSFVRLSREAGPADPGRGPIPGSPSPWSYEDIPSKVDNNLSQVFRLIDPN